MNEAMSRPARVPSPGKKAGPEVSVLVTYPPGTITAQKGTSLANLHNSILRGLSFARLTVVAAGLGMAPESMARSLGVSRATFHRKMKQPKQLLSALESDALSRYASLLSQALETFDGDEDAARQWLNSKQPGLGNAIPLDLARTTVGFREVEKLLRRIDLGVYA